jgi:hypothetical protein
VAHFKVRSMKNIFIIFILLPVIVQTFDLCHGTSHAGLVYIYLSTLNSLFLNPLSLLHLFSGILVT